MHLTLLIIATLLGLVATGSAGAKLAKKPDVVEQMTHVGVSAGQIPLLAVLELLGALGLLVGIWSAPIGIAAAAGLVLYFAGAVGAHRKVKDAAKDYAPAFVLFVVAAVTVALEVHRLK